MTELVQIGLARSNGHVSAPEIVCFCSSCGRLFEHEPEHRVCPDCALGVVLTGARDALPEAYGAFLVVDRDLTVSAVSAAGERLVGEAMGHSISSLIRVRGANGELARQVARAASGLSGTVRLHASVRGRRGAFDVRICPCGPPRAALVSLRRASD